MGDPSFPLNPTAGTATAEPVEPGSEAVAGGSAWASPRRAKGLAQGLFESLAGELRSQRIQPGDRLPTEQAIMQRFGVSRGVVREALSRLQAAGLVQTQHGVGTFALAPAGDARFRLGHPTALDFADMLALLELRASVESDAAGLAASRRGDADLAAMREALDEFAAHISSADPSSTDPSSTDPSSTDAASTDASSADHTSADSAAAGDTVAPDFRFHLAIARATGNHHYADLMGQLGMAVIPRSRVATTRLEGDARERHLQKVHQEHRDIYAAIERRDPEAARAAMRIHLVNSRERQRRARGNDQSG